MIRRFEVSLAVAMSLSTSISWAAQQQDANLYAYFKWDGRPYFQNMDQQLSVRKKAAYTYWAMVWQMDHGPGSAGGYMGLQTNGSRFDGSHGDTAIFSIWGSTGHDGPSCGKFPYESGGTGFSCRVPYPINIDHWYRLRVKKVSEDARSVWWGAWVLDETTGTETYIGKLKVAATETSISGQMNFSEYYGDAVARPDLVPQSIVYWTSPSADLTASGNYQFNSVFSNGTRAKGTTGSVKAIGPVNTPAGVKEVVQIIQGGPY